MVLASLNRVKHFVKIARISEYLELVISIGGYLRWPLEFRWRNRISSKVKSPEFASPTRDIFCHFAHKKNQKKIDDTYKEYVVKISNESLSFNPNAVDFFHRLNFAEENEYLFFRYFLRKFVITIFEEVIFLLLIELTFEE